MTATQPGSKDPDVNPLSQDLDLTDTAPPGSPGYDSRHRELEVQGRLPTTESDALAHRVILDRVEAMVSGEPVPPWRHFDVEILAPDTAWTAVRTHGGHLNPGLVAAIGNLLLNGMSATGVRRALCIGDDVWYSWMEKGAESQEPYTAFRRVVETSQGVVEHDAVRTWVKASVKDWRAAKELLQSRHPDDYLPNRVVEVTSTGGDGNVPVPMGEDDVRELVGILTQIGVLGSIVAPTTDRNDVIDIPDADVVE